MRVVWRRVAAAGLAIALLLTLLNLPAAAHQAGAVPRLPANMQPAALPPPLPFGLEVEGWSVPGWNLWNWDARLADVGATWTRVNHLSWREVELVEGGPYNWSRFDTAFSAMPASGAVPIIVIADNPLWARVDTAVPSGPIRPDKLQRLVDFTVAAVQRYGAAPYSFKYWEMYNEPDSRTALFGAIIGSWGDYGAQYGEMLRAVYPAVKQADPDAQVVFGGLAYEQLERDGVQLFNRAFLGDALTVLTAGGGACTGSPCFDVFSYHYYRFGFEGVWWQYGRDLLGKANYLRTQLASFGLQNVPFVATEVAEPGPSGAPATWDAALAESQGRYIPKVYARALAGGLLSVVWFSLYNGTEGMTGLIDNSFPNDPKPAYFVFRQMTRQLAGAVYHRQVLPADVLLAGDPSSGDVAALFEAYGFRTAAPDRYVVVAWLNTTQTTPNPMATLSVPAAYLDYSPKEDVAPVRRAAGANGRVAVELTSSPVYLVLPAELQPNPLVNAFLPMARSR